jgi:glycosyltransferase involved in cell wall biosynthesis
MSVTSQRPEMTFAMLTYNQARFIREAVDAAFSLTYEPLEIILSDDCSSDETFAIMKKMAAAYSGPHKVIVRQNEKNQGLAEHFNIVVGLATGAFVVSAAGDDISESDRCEVSLQPFLEDPSVSFVSTGYQQIDDNSVRQGKPVSEPDHFVTLQDWVTRRRVRLHGCTRTYRRAALLKFPPLNRDCPTEDSTCKLRCLMVGKEKFLEAQTIRYRKHENNLSGENSLRQMNVEAILAQYLSDSDHALREGYVSKEMHRKTSRWAQRNILQRQINQNLQRNRTWQFRDFAQVLLAPKVSLSGKLSIIRTTIRKTGVAKLLLEGRRN